MKEFLSVVTRKGQVTIPVEIRRALAINEGDKIAFEVEEGKIHITRHDSVVARTAGALRSNVPMFSPQEEREAAEHAIAADVLERMEG